MKFLVNREVIRMKQGTNMKIRDMTYIAMFAVVIAVCSWLSIPTEVPFTLQTFGVFVAVGILGGKKGSLSVLIYMLLGVIGAPVFAGFTGGIGCLLGTTGGYIMGFMLSALVMWGMECLFGRKTLVLGVSMVLGLLVCYLFGTLWFMMVYARASGPIGVWTALGWCVFPYIIPDALKIVLAMIVCKRMANVIKLD